ncbi:MAG TPA: hypothetical protein VN943_11390 [Candidatus Acidoferrum sp.]|nr:hypothetical protein [Candidatus Acidoferrum sp.]
MATSLLSASALFRRWKLDPRSPRLRQANGYDLLGGADAMFAFAHVRNFLANEFASLR